MSTQDDFIKRLELYEHNEGSLSENELRWLDDLKHAANACGELSLKKELETFYSEHKKKEKTRQLLAITGIAAMLVLASTFLMPRDSGEPVKLNFEEAPIYSDSAKYDSTKKFLDKNLPEDVDN